MFAALIVVIVSPLPLLHVSVSAAATSPLDQTWPGAAHRQLAVIVFLSTARDGGDPEGFTGGVLRLYSEEGEPIDIVPVEGTLVAFPATTLHEVTRVGEAVRDAVVDWFY